MDDKIEDTRNKILNGENKLEIREKKQQEHILGTEKWKSYFERKIKAGSIHRPTMFDKEIDVKELVNEYA